MGPSRTRVPLPLQASCKTTITTGKQRGPWEETVRLPVVKLAKR